MTSWPKPFRLGARSALDAEAGCRRPAELVDYLVRAGAALDRGPSGLLAAPRADRRLVNPAL